MGPSVNMPLDLFLVIKLPSSCFFSFALPFPNGLSLVPQFKLCSAYSGLCCLDEFNPLHFDFAGTLTIKGADLLGASLGFAWGSWHPQIYSQFIFYLWERSIGGFFFLLLFCFFFLNSLFFGLRVTFGSRQAKYENY